MLTKKKAKLTFEEFQQRFGDELYDGQPGPGEPPWMPDTLFYAELRRRWPIRWMAKAAEVDSPDAFLSMLKWWLTSKLGIDPPDGVFVRHARKRGRPRSERLSDVWITWIVLEKPSLTSTTLAKAYYGKEYHSANLPDRKRMIDRLRQSVLYYEKNSGRLSS